jgi:hypothetical protein
MLMFMDSSHRKWNVYSLPLSSASPNKRAHEYHMLQDSKGMLCYVMLCSDCHSNNTTMFIATERVETSNCILLLGTYSQTIRYFNGSRQIPLFVTNTDRTQMQQQASGWTCEVKVKVKVTLTADFTAVNFSMEGSLTSAYCGNGTQLNHSAASPHDWFVWVCVCV